MNGIGGGAFERSFRLDEVLRVGSHDGISDGERDLS
jgi:hypothetical protein